MQNSIADFIADHIKNNPAIISQTINNYVTMIESSPDLSAEYERDLITRAKFEGDEDAKSELFTSYIKLVFGVAKKYVISSVNFEDLVQEGVLGLEDTLEHFELERNLRFSTLAKWWVRARILKYIKDNIRGFSVPTEATSKIFAVSRCVESLKKELGHSPTNLEIGDELGMHEGHIAFLRKFLNHSVSLNDAVDSNNEFSHTVQDLLTDDRNNAQESLIRDDGITSIRRAIGKLPYAQKTIIENRYGLGCDEMTLEELGKKMNLSAERIRQIQRDAEKKLKLMVNK